MLNKYSKIVLKKLISTDFRYNNIDEFAQSIPKMSKTDIENTLVYLDEQGYIECIYADNTVYALSPTYTGEHYRQFTAVEIKKFLINSVAVPIVVAVITSILVNIICKIIW